MSDNVVSIFRKASSLHQTLGVLNEALQQRDEVTVLNQLDELMNTFKTDDNLLLLLQEALQKISDWDNPYLVMTAAAKVIKASKAGTAYSQTGLQYYLDAATSVRNSHPMTTMGACVFAQPYALETPYKARINDEVAFITQNVHPIQATALLEGLLELYDSVTDEHEDGTPLTGHVLRLADMIAPYDENCAMDAYLGAIDNLPRTDKRFQPTLESLFALCQRVAARNDEAAHIGLDQILEYTEPQDPIHQQAQAFKDTLARRLTERDYTSTLPLNPKEFLAQKRLQPG